MAPAYESTGEWRLDQEDGNTIAEFDWRPSVNKSFVESLTPVLRPLFRFSHNWAMKRGLERILAHLAEG